MKLKFWQIIIGIGFFVALAYRLVLAFFPSSNSGGAENSVIYFSQRLLAGQTIYSDPAQPPFAIAQYTPIYYYVLAFLARLTSTGVGDVLKLFILNRSLALFLDLCTCFLSARILKRVFNVPDALAYCAAMIAFMVTVPWSRNDNLAILFWMAAFYCFLKFTNTPDRNRYLLWTVVFAVLSVLSKQSGITIVVAIGLWLMVSRLYAKAILFYLLFPILFFAGLVLLTPNSSLKDVYKNIVLGVDNGISFQYYFNVIASHLLTSHLVFILGFIVGLAFLLKEKSSARRLLALTMVAQFVLVNVFALKKGSGINYLTEWNILVVMAVAMYANKLADQLSVAHASLAAWIVCVIVLANTAMYLSPGMWYRSRSVVEWAHKQYDLQKAVAGRVGTGNQYVVTDIPGPNAFYGNLLGKQLLFPQSDVTGTLYYKGVYDYSRFHEIAAKGEIEYLITQKPVDSFKLYDVNFGRVIYDTVIWRHYIYKLQK